MRVTTKGQVTIPQHIRERLGITPHSEVDFVLEDGKVILVKTEDAPAESAFDEVLGVATTGMSTDEIMALTRGE